MRTRLLMALPLAATLVVGLGMTQAPKPTSVVVYKSPT